MGKKFVLYLLAFLPMGSLFGHDGVVFTPNEGQWEGDFRFRAKMTFGNIYLEDQGITYLFYDKRPFSREHHFDSTLWNTGGINAHSVKVSFVGSNPHPDIHADHSLSWYENYYLGNDPSRWKTNVKSHRAVNYTDIYPGIGLKFYQYGTNLKYDFIVSPVGDPSDIVLDYEGYENLKLVDGNLIVTNSLGSVKEMAPVAYQRINGTLVEIECDYLLTGSQVTFIFPNGYDSNYELIIDPVLVFSSYSGSTSDNWGYTATYDNSEHLYGGGIVFGAGYPTTTGAYQITFASGVGTVDIGISKFTPTGNNLLFSTYIGGSSSESPHSLVVDSLDNLYVLASTGSSNFPTTAGSYDNTYNGGASVTISGVSYVGGSDLAIAKLNSTGTALLASTFLGGSANDGLNNSTGVSYFYGDAYRGEIVVDAAGNCIVASTTFSTNFPTTAGAPQTAHGGLTDAVLTMFDSNLSTLISSTYWGGSGYESGYGIQFDGNGNVFLSGATTSSNMATTTGSFKPVFGGIADGYIAKFNPGITTLLSSTFIGTASKDLTFFVQIDQNDDVYVIGVSEGAYPVSTGVYSNPGSNQFIQKLNNGLTTGAWSTVIGTGNGTVDISPTAFLVNDCGLIYVSGWGGTLSGQNIATSTTSGLPTTTNGYQTSTDGSDFYIMVLTQNAQALLYGTFFGSGIVGEHVDGGTSRFDKNGVIYHAVCAGCGGNSNFPTTPGAWSTTNNSANCNLGVFKFGLTNIQTLISLPAPYVCIPSSYTFGNNTVGANYYIWDFGDGDSSYLFEPTHVYQDTGTFTVTLIALDTNGCIDPDTAQVVIDVFSIADAEVDTVPILCPGDTVQLNASGGVYYSWFPQTNMINPTSPTPLVFPDVTTTYYAVIEDSCIKDTVAVTVTVFANTTSTTPDTSVCLGQSVQIGAFGGVSYAWHADPTLSNLSVQDPVATPAVSTTYYVDVTTADGCVITDSVFVLVYFTPPIPVMPADTIICLSDTIQLTVSGAPTIHWITNNNIDPLSGPTVNVWPAADETYVVEFTNGCATVYDSIHIAVNSVPITIAPDTAICIGDSVKLYAGGGISYAWTPANFVLNSSSPVTYAIPNASGSFNVTVTDALGCSDVASMYVMVNPLPDVYAGIDKQIEYGGSTVLDGISNSGVIYSWTPADSLSCINCLTPTASPLASTDYILQVIDTNGCRNSDTVTVLLEGNLYIPNAFTPNGDGKNDFFEAIGAEIAFFEMHVFDRWGELVFYTDNINKAWTGSVKGKPAKSDVYVWVIRYAYLVSPQQVEKKIGHVTLIR